MKHTFTAAPLAMQAIALESEFLGNMVKTVSNYFPAMMEHMAPLVGRIGSTQSDMKKGLTHVEGKIADAINALDYAGHTSYFKIEVPEGFQGNTVQYLSALHGAFEYFKNVTAPGMDDYYILIASILTNKEAKKSLKDHSVGFAALAKGRVAMNDNLGSFFKEKSTEAMSTFGKHFKNNEELAHAFKMATALEQDLESLKLDTVKDKTQRIADTMEKLVQQADEGKIAYLTTQVVAGLTQGAFEIASQVEFLSVNVYRALGILKSLEVTTERMERLI